MSEGRLVSSTIHHHTFTVDERFTFTKKKILGFGSYGVVALAFDTKRKVEVAIKRVRPYAEDELYAKLSLREIRCLQLLGSHPNVMFFFLHRIIKI